MQKKGLSAFIKKQQTKKEKKSGEAATQGEVQKAQDIEVEAIKDQVSKNTTSGAGKRKNLLTRKRTNLMLPRSKSITKRLWRRIFPLQTHMLEIRTRRRDTVSTRKIPRRTPRLKLKRKRRKQEGPLVVVVAVAILFLVTNHHSETETKELSKLPTMTSPLALMTSMRMKEPPKRRAERDSSQEKQDTSNRLRRRKTSKNHLVSNQHLEVE